MSRKYEWEFYFQSYSQLGNFAIEPPIEWEELNIQVSWEDIGTSSIEIDELTFVNEAYSYIKNIFENGNLLSTTILVINLLDKVNSKYIFEQDFFLDLRTVVFYDDVEIPKVTVKLKDIKSGSTLTDFLNANTFLNIYNPDTNTVTNNDFINMLTRVGVVVEKEDTTLEQIVLYVTLYQLTVQLADAVKTLAKTIADTVAHTAGGFSGPVAGIAYGIALSILQLAYVISIIIAMRELVLRLQVLLFPIPFTRWCLRLGDAIKGIFRQAGYEEVIFSNDINETINDYYYLPSNIEELEDSTNQFFPRPSDYGYTFSEFVDMVLKIYEAKIFLIDNSIVISNENEDFLFDNSTYQLPNILEKPYTTNLEDFNSKEIYQFKTDLSDEYTIKNYKGTSYEVDYITENNFYNKKIKDVDYGLTLGNRKDDKSVIETIFGTVIDTMNAILKILLQKPISKPILSDRIGLLKVSDKSWSLPKLLYLKESNATYLGKKVYKIPSNHRNLLSANYLYNKHHYKMSFENPKNRRRKYEQVRVFFDYNSFKQLIVNNYFSIEGSSKKGRVVDLEWNIDSDYAIINYYIIDSYNIGNLTIKLTEV